MADLSPPPADGRERRRHAVVLAISVVLALAALEPVRDGVWATLFLLDFVSGDSPTLYKHLTSSPTVSVDILAGAGPAVSYDLYTPGDGAAPRAAAVLTHGMAHLGRRDPRVRQQAERLARAGYLVMAPDLERMRAYGLSLDDVEAAARSIETLAGLPAARDLPLGVVAPSFGAGPVLIALSQARLLIVHSDADDKVSFTEGLALSRHLPAAPPPRLVIVSLFRHMDLNLGWDSLAALIRHGVPDALALWRLSYDLMHLRQ